MKSHISPWECILAKEDRSLCKLGIKPKSDREYFEILCLCILQSGLGWGTVRKNWSRYKKGFSNFDIDKIAKLKINDLMKKSGVIKNERKMRAIIENAKRFRKIKQDYGSFSKFLNSLKDRDTIREISENFDHLGNYSAEYFLHSVGFRI